MPEINQPDIQAEEVFEGLRIVLLVHSLLGGGAERVTVNLATDWADCGARVRIVILGNADQKQYDLPENIDFTALGLAATSRGPVQAMMNNIKRLLGMRKFLAREKPDVVIGMGTTMATLLALIRTKRYIAIGSEHNHPPMQPIGPVWSFLRRWSYTRLDSATVLTGQTRDWIAANTRAKKIAVLPNAISLPLPLNAPFLPLEKVMVSGRKMLLAVGRLQKVKGFDCLIEAFGEVHVDHPDWDLVILGEGTERTALEAQIRTDGLQNRIKMPGWAGNIADWYQAADLFAVTSLTEGFPMGLVEAMAHGCAAVSVDCDTGPRDIIDHNRNGILVPQDDPAALVGALDRLMRDEDLRAKLGHAATEVTDRFSPARINARWATLLQPTAQDQGLD
ncbi:glycosyltransferase family 4 protein [Pseudorhodobacter ferrugineus]|uniref:glycosyltransferase family 4 protein n=1 Tax=Pseudorhodobacter ferrugineus TaxID=77008 RepID=UPI0003B62828|nr:glycosyltransferase family 4 protein [Pseudorhodobacter ferrugineus]